MEALTFALRSATWPLRFFARLALLFLGLFLLLAAWGASDGSAWAAVGYLVAAGLCFTTREVLY